MRIDEAKLVTENIHHAISFQNGWLPSKLLTPDRTERKRASAVAHHNLPRTARSVPQSFGYTTSGAEATRQTELHESRIASEMRTRDESVLTISTASISNDASRNVQDFSDVHPTPRRRKTCIDDIDGTHPKTSMQVRSFVHPSPGSGSGTCSRSGEVTRLLRASVLISESFLSATPPAFAGQSCHLIKIILFVFFCVNTQTTSPAPGKERWGEFHRERETSRTSELRRVTSRRRTPSRRRFLILPANGMPRSGVDSRSRAYKQARVPSSLARALARSLHPGTDKADFAF